MDELYHHGIKGQKWGVRRYQEPSGTWTEEGLRRRRKYEMTPAKKKMLDTDFETADKSTIHEDWDVYKKAKKGIIEKGTPVYRSTTRLENNDETRKYGSITQGGGKYYWDAVGTDKMPMDWDSNDKYLYRFEATKDLKVAKVKDIQDYAETLAGKKFIHKQEETMETFVNEEHMVRDDLSGLNKTENYKETNRFINHFKDLGYDAIPDMVDLGWNYDNMSGAMIFLKPYESLKVTDIYSDKNVGWRIPYDSGIEEYRKSGKLDKHRVG